MATGAHGVVSVASNIAPGEIAAMVEALQREDIATARALHHRLFPLFKACFAESSPGPCKAALSLLGLCGETLRLPLVPVAPATKELMHKVLSELWK